MFIQNYMTTDPRSIHPSASAHEAWELLRAGGFHQAPVVDGNGNLLGIVTDRDIRSALGFDRQGRLAGSGRSADLRVEDIMTADPVCIEQDRPIEEALQEFCRLRFGALPVMHRKKLVGIITRSDLLKAFHVLLGLERPGSRIEVAIPDGPASVAAVMSNLSEADQISSVVAARLRTDGSEPILYIRTQLPNPWKLERRLRAGGAIVLAPESAPS